MPRQRLEQLSLAELKKEVKSCDVLSILNSKEKCIEAILSHLEKCNPEDALDILHQEVPGNPNFSIPSSADAANAPGFSLAPSFTGTGSGSSMDSFLPQFCSFMAQQAQLQREQMSQVQQLLVSLVINNNQRVSSNSSSC